MGELRTRKRGSKWEWSFEGAKVEGKRNPISKGGYRTKADAITAGTQAKAEYDNAGKVFLPSEISVSDYLDFWLESQVKINLAHNTYMDYKNKIDNHIKPAFGIYRLSAMEPDIIQKWVNVKKLDGLSKSMVSGILSTLSSALNYAVIPCKYIKSNPCTYVKLPKFPVDKSQKEFREYVCMGDDFERVITRFPEGSNFYLPIMTGYCLGTRIGETYAIDLLSDVDLDNDLISINRQIQSENGLWIFKNPKYDSFRTIRMGREYQKIIRREIKERKKNMLRYGKYYTHTYATPDNHIIQLSGALERPPYKEIWPLSVKENGELLTPNTFKYCARVIHNELELPFFHSHCLRHTHGTILAEGGANPKTVMERLGHKDIKITLETYTFNTEKMQEDAVNIFEAAVF